MIRSEREIDFGIHRFGRKERDGHSGSCVGRQALGKKDRVALHLRDRIPTAGTDDLPSPVETGKSQRDAIRRPLIAVLQRQRERIWHPGDFLIG